MRLLPIFFHGYFMLTCPTACLLTGTVATLLTANSRGYCGTRLLSHPLGRGRLAALATFLEFGSLPLVALQPTGHHLQPAGAVMAGACGAGWGEASVSIPPGSGAPQLPCCACWTRCC